MAGSVIVGSARVDELGKYSGGTAGDQKQKSTPDRKGEVSMQDFYVHKKGWKVIRPVNPLNATDIAKAMERACNNKLIGYDQGQRLNILKATTRTTKATECDCSSLVRECIIEATGIDPGNFTTQNEVSALAKTKLFHPAVEYKTGMRLLSGDVLVTRSKGHTVIVVQGEAAATPKPVEYFPQCLSPTRSIVDGLVIIGANGSFENRIRIAAANGFPNYTGTVHENTTLLNLLKNGRLVKP